MIRTGRRLAAALLSASVALGAAGCGGDDDGGTPDEPSAEASSGTAAPSTGASGSAEPTAGGSEGASEGGSAVAPAAGIELAQTVVAVNAPEGWEEDEAPADFSSAARGPGRSDSLLLVDNPSLAGPGATIDDLYDSYVMLNEDDAQLTFERLPDLDLAGTPASYVHSSRKGTKAEDWTVTAVRGDRVVSLTFTLDPGTLQQDPQLVESVLASLRWLD